MLDQIQREVIKNWLLMELKRAGDNPTLICSIPTPRITKLLSLWWRLQRAAERLRSWVSWTLLSISFVGLQGSPPFPLFLCAHCRDYTRRALHTRAWGVPGEWLARAWGGHHKSSPSPSFFGNKIIGDHGYPVCSSTVYNCFCLQ